MRKLRNGLALSVLAIASCNNGDVDRLGKVARTVAARFDSLTDGAQGKLAGGWHSAGSSISDAALEHRVANRIRWDQRLHECEIEVDCPEPKVVRLRGNLDSLEDRQRAVDLAQSTAGVTRMMDELTTE